MTLLRIGKCVICHLPLPPATGDLVHPICAARANQGLPIMLDVMEGCCVCGGAFADTLIDTKGKEFTICHHCRFSNRKESL